jgi:hypothetical protein
VQSSGVKCSEGDRQTGRQIHFVFACGGEARTVGVVVGLAVVVVGGA